MSKEHTPFRYDHVGSFLRPAKLKQARLDFQAGKIDAAALKAVEDEAIVDLVHKQQKAGYHAITDGEFRRATWHLDFSGASTASVMAVRKILLCWLRELVAVRAVFKTLRGDGACKALSLGEVAAAVRLRIAGFGEGTPQQDSEGTE